MNLLIPSSYLTSITLLITFLFLLYKYITANYDHWKKRNIPYLEPHFPFGIEGIATAIRHSTIGDFLGDVYKKSKGEMVGFWIFGSPFLLIRSQRLFKNILVKDFNYFADRAVVSNEKAEPIISKALFLVKNPEWKFMRRKVTPIFTGNKLRKMTSLIDTAAKDLNKYLKNHTGVLEAKEVSSKYTIDVLTSCAFGVNAHCFENDQAPFHKAGMKLFELNWVNTIRSYAYFLMPGLVHALKVRMFDAGATDFLASAFWDTIKHRESSKEPRNDLIDIIISLKDELDIGNGIKFEGDRVVAQAMQFYIAGFETTSSTISFILYELALHSEVQDKARKEIMQILEECENLDYEALQNAKYLDKVIAETLRKCPSLPFLDRICMADYKDPELDVVIPKGTPVFIPIMGVHYDPEFYPDPEKFDPERFSEENVKKRPEFTYFPFGQGPRNCVGERFALIATKLALIHILKDFEIEPCKETPARLEFSPASFLLQVKGGGVPLRFNKL